jgi:uroporphyrin-III C-methyltransferase
MSCGKEKIGKVYLVGAGPGDPKLLTFKAAEAIAQSDVIIYDYLVNPEILSHAARGAELIYAGKRAGTHSVTQSEINRLIVTRALSGQTVARLKGGDPFVFGRGGEEAEALADAGINWEVIPGISAGVAAASYAGIPLTHRGRASSVAFVTGHESRKARTTVDWTAMAKAADTIVIFMCAETIGAIALSLIEGGRLLSTPVAVIRWATYPDQEVYTGTLGDLAADEGDGTGAFKIEPPAIAIVGEVVSLGDHLRWFGSRSSYSLEAVLA